MGRATSRQQWTFSTRRRFLQAELAGRSTSPLLQHDSPFFFFVACGTSHSLSLSRARLQGGSFLHIRTTRVSRSHLPRKSEKKEIRLKKRKRDISHVPCDGSRAAIPPPPPFPPFELSSQPLHLPSPLLHIRSCMEQK